MLAVEAEGLRKEYGSTVAVDGINLHVDQGEVFGFLGPNGAGKTTTIKILTTLIPQTSGTARVLGYDVRKDAAKLRSRIGVVQQQPSGEYAMRIEDQLDLYGMMWNIPKDERQQRREALLEAFGLQPHRRERWNMLSIGLRRRLQVAREFMHDMDLLLLDEPTVGLDPIARRAALDMIRKRVSQGLTVFFTTHIMEEVEYLCDRVAIIDKGKIVATDTPKGLRQRFGDLQTVEAIVEGDNPAELVSQLKQLDQVTEVVTNNNGEVKITTSNSSEVLRTLAVQAERLGLKLVKLNLQEPTLEQAFVRIITRENAS